MTRPSSSASPVRRLVAAVVATAAIAGVASAARAQGGPPPPPPPHGMQGMHEGRGMRGGEPGMMFGGSPERVARMADRLLDGLNTTDDQRAQIKRIVTAAASDLQGQRDAGRRLRERGLALFAAPTVDAAAVESLRQQALADHDQASRRVTQAMLDIAKVLTPEQRAALGQRFRDRAATMRERLQRMLRERASAPR